MRLRPVALVVLAGALVACGKTGSGICDCRSDQTCIRGRCFDSGAGGSSGEPVAAPATCPAPTQVVGAPIGTPQPGAGQCSVPVQVSGAPAEWTPLRFGPKQVGTTIPFNVPANTSSLTIELQAAGPVVPQIRLRDGSVLDNTAVPLRLVAPDGSIWYDDLSAQAADASQQLVFFASDSPAVGTVTVPNTTRALQVIGTGGLPAGAWSMVVGDFAYECSLPQLAADCGTQAGLVPPPDVAAYAAGVYDVTVVLKPGPQPGIGAHMDVAFYLHGCPGAQVDANGACTARPLTAATAATDRDTQRMLQTYAGLLASAGVCLGQVSWYDLPAWAQARWAAGLDLDTTTCDLQLGQLLTLAQPGNQMNLFLMPTLLAVEPDGSRTQTVGIDGTIPGPAALPGTVQSGAAASAANLRERPELCTGPLSTACGADVTAYIGAHETGHFLGLYHTSESGGTSFDPIDDTPHCECRSCVPQALAGQCGTARAQVTALDCSKATTTCGGGKNLMFWVLDALSQGTISPQQSSVMRSSALVR